MVMRINGTSGLDVDSTVAQLMKAKRIPVDKLTQQKTTFQWQRTSYQEMNTKILDFRSNKLFNYRLQGTYSASKVDLTGNTAAVTAKATGDAVTGTLNVVVNTVAAAATNYSTGDIRKVPTATFDPSKTLSSQSANLQNYSPTTSFSINGTPVSFNPDVDSLNSVIAKINQTTNVSAYYNATSGKVSFGSRQTGLTNNIADATSLSGKHITFSGDFLTNTLQVSTASINAVAAANANANVIINGLTTTQTSTTNTFTVNGIQITANQAGGAATTLNVSTDTDKIVDSVKSFIKDYNDTLKMLEDKVNEPKYRGFPPLTDAQKTGMKDADIANWETKAKSGLLNNDEILKKAISNMRMSIITPIPTGDAIYKTLSSIGIQTGLYNEGGKLYLTDETKLRAAIQANPAAVATMFTAKGNGTADRSSMGVAEKMYQDLNDTLSSIAKKAGYLSTSNNSSNDSSIIGKKIYLLNNDIDKGNVRLKGIEDRYYKQFTAMETSMNKYNAQSTYLTNSFSNNSSR